MTSATLERARQFISGIVRKKQEVKKSLWKSYDDLVERLVDGEEIDGDEFEAILEACGKTEQDLLGDPHFQGKGWIVEFNGDVERKQKRRVWARELQELKELQSTKIPQLEAELTAAQEKLKKVLEPLQRAVTEAQNRLSEANAKTLQLSSAEGYLCQTVANPEILQREQEILDRRTKLRDREIELNEVHRQEFAVYDFEVKELTRLPKIPIDAEKSPHVASQRQKEIESLKHSIESKRLSVERARRELDEIKQEQSRLTREMEELAKLKLVP